MQIIGIFDIKTRNMWRKLFNIYPESEEEELESESESESDISLTSSVFSSFILNQIFSC